MAISGKDVQESMRKVVKLSMEFSVTCVKTHPYVSCTVIFLLLLYLCFPWLFWLIIYLASFLSLASAIAKFYFSFSINAKIARGDEKKNDPKSFTTRRLVRNDVHARSVRRRRSKEPSRDESLQTSEEEKNTVFSSTVNNVRVDKTALVEEHPKEIREVQVDSVTTRGECSTSNSLRGLRPKKFDAGKGDRESESSESTEDDEREKEENNKAVRWSEDDQKNLMDLGLSEIERNKRLESLIARRRARKLLSLQVRRTLMNLDRNEPFGRINPITVHRNNLFPASHSPGKFSPMPGSAPSVLIPMDNPFDLPYDPQEEKPILTGGSFHQEFLPVLQKDMFCRHESFSLGPFFPGEKNQGEREAFLFHDAATKQRSFEGHENSKLENQLEPKDADKIIKVESSQQPKSNSEIAEDHIYTEDVQSPELGLDSVTSHQEEDSEEIQTKLMLTNDSSGHSSSASSSELDIPFSRLDRDAILESLASPLQRNIFANRDSRSEMDSDLKLNGSGLSLLDKNKMEDRFFCPHRAVHHKPTFSIASDLQVEVSEISSSPPLTIDGSISSYDEEVPLCEGNMERGVTSSGGDTWATSSHPSGGGENDSRLRDIHEVRENNAIEINGFLGKQRSEDTVAKQKMEEKIIEEGTNLHSQSISVAELLDGGQDQTSSLNSTIEETFQMSAGTDSSHAISFKTPTSQALEQASRSTDELMAERPRNCESHKLENFQGEFRTTYNANYSSILQKLNTKNIVFNEKDTGADLLMREGGRPQPEWSLTSSPTSIGYPESQCEIIEDHRNMFEYYHPTGENYNVEPSEDFGGDSMKLPQPEKMDESTLVEEHYTRESIQDNDQHEQQTTDQVFPEVHESFRSHQVSQLLPQSIVQQVPIASVSSFSPRSVLEPKFSIGSLSIFSEEMHAENQQFNGQIAENHVPSEPRGESFIYNEPHNTTLSMEDSASHRLQGTDAEISQEYSNPSTTSTKEARITGNVSEQVTEGNTQSLTSPESTTVVLKPEEETVSRILEEKYERSGQLHEHEPGGDVEASGSNKKMEELADATGLEKRQLPKLDDENTSGLDKPFEATSGIDTANEVKEIDPAAEGAEGISPDSDNHIACTETQEELLEPPGRLIDEGTGHSK